ncbi:MAG TPA: ABC transporter permease [Jatrophihabitans sp.]|jgi:lipooligosaccharide transport system permease protein
MTSTTQQITEPRITVPLRITPVFAAARNGAYWRLVERNARLFSRIWFVFVSGFFEPFFYLLSIGVGVGSLVSGLNVGGHVYSYASFVGPALMATAAMNGAMADATFNLYFRLKISKLYDSVLVTPMTAMDVALGELTWAMLRGSTYSLAFLVIMWPMGLLHSGWAILAWPMASLVGFAFAGVGMAATTYLRSWIDFEYIQIATMPMFLFSATFFPVERYPDAVGWIVRITPLYQGVAAIRELTLGQLGWQVLIAAVYLGAMGLVGLALAGRRFEKLLLH